MCKNRRSDGDCRNMKTMSVYISLSRLESYHKQSVGRYCRVATARLRHLNSSGWGGGQWQVDKIT